MSMVKTNGEFSAIVHAVLEKTPVRELLGSRDAVVEILGSSGVAVARYPRRFGVALRP